MLWSWLCSLWDGLGKEGVTKGMINEYKTLYSQQMINRKLSLTPNIIRSSTLLLERPRRFSYRPTQLRLISAKAEMWSLIQEFGVLNLNQCLGLPMETRRGSQLVSAFITSEALSCRDYCSLRSLPAGQFGLVWLWGIMLTPIRTYLLEWTISYRLLAE